MSKDILGANKDNKQTLTEQEYQDYRAKSKELFENVAKEKAVFTILLTFSAFLLPIIFCSLSNQHSNSVSGMFSVSGIALLLIGIMYIRWLFSIEVKRAMEIEISESTPGFCEFHKGYRLEIIKENMEKSLRGAGCVFAIVYAVVSILFSIATADIRPRKKK